MKISPLHPRQALFIPVLAFAASGWLSSAAQPAVGAPDGDEAATELVLQRQPDSVEGFAKMVRNGYDVCVAAAQVRQLPVKPFPVLPPTLGLSRVTYLIRGHDIVVSNGSTEVLGIGTMFPDKGCDVPVGVQKKADVDIVEGNRHISVTTTPDGRPVVNDEDITDLRRANAAMPIVWPKIFTEPRTVIGIAMRCLPRDSRALNPAGLQDKCISAREGYLAYSDGKPIALVVRAKPMGADPRFPYVMVTEPVSVRVIQHPDPRLFTAAAYMQ